jgi:hypothetical protein
MRSACASADAPCWRARRVPPWADAGVALGRGQVVRQRTLDPRSQVRILAPQPCERHRIIRFSAFLRSFASFCTLEVGSASSSLGCVLIAAGHLQSAVVASVSL